MSSPSSADPPPTALAIHLDLVGGIAGDMFVAALLDALPELAAPLFAELAKVQPRDADAPALGATTQAGMRASRFGLGQGSPRKTVVATPSAGRSYASLRDAIASAPLEPSTKREALAILALLAQAEADVHGIGLESVHFHELADWDSLLDVVAAGFIVARLAGAQWTASAAPLGGGVVKSAHGALPVPAPATARLLAGTPWRDDGIAGERVTPTGAAILRHLVSVASYDEPRSGGRLIAIGMGAGTKTMPGLANVTRALVFERVAPGRAGDVATIEFDVDDMTGEELALAAERLRATQGVIDASLATRVGKKGRVFTDFRLLVDPAQADLVAQACFVETSTLGLRIGEARRHVLRRAEVRVDALGVKIAHRPSGERTAKAEHDDVRAGASLGERRRLRAAAERKALEDEE